MQDRSQNLRLSATSRRALDAKSASPTARTRRRWRPPSAIRPHPPGPRRLDEGDQGLRSGEILAGVVAQTFETGLPPRTLAAAPEDGGAAAEGLRPGENGTGSRHEDPAHVPGELVLLPGPHEKGGGIVLPVGVEIHNEGPRRAQSHPILEEGLPAGKAIVFEEQQQASGSHVEIVVQALELGARPVAPGSGHDHQIRLGRDHGRAHQIEAIHHHPLGPQGSGGLAQPESPLVVEISFPVAGDESHTQVPIQDETTKGVGVVGLRGGREGEALPPPLHESPPGIANAVSRRQSRNEVRIENVEVEPGIAPAQLPEEGLRQGGHRASASREDGEGHGPLHLAHPMEGGRSGGEEALLREVPLPWKAIGQEIHLDEKDRGQEKVEGHGDAVAKLGPRPASPLPPRHQASHEEDGPPPREGPSPRG